MTIFKTVFLTILMIGFSFAPSVSWALDSEMTEPDRYVQVRIIANQTDVNGGETIRLGIEQTIYPTWHTYWLNPGDSGTPTSIEWDLPPGFSATDLEWPTPSKIPFGPLTNYGYEGEVVLLQNLKIPEYIGSTPFALNGTVNLLVCHDICIPETHDIFVAFNTDTKPEIERIAMAETKRPIEVTWPATFYAEGDQLVVNALTDENVTLKGAKNIVIAPEDWGAVDNNAKANLEVTKTGLRITQKLGDRDLKEIQNLPLILSYESAMGKKQAIRFTAAYEEQANTATALSGESNSSSKDKGLNILTALIFALLGGIVLNLMPCVFPVLSMKALSLINIGEKEEAKARGYGLSYTAGILISFGIIGGILLVLKASGAQIGWGFQLQNPIVIMALTYLIFVIGLNLAGFFEFTARLGKLGNATQKLSTENGHRGAFFTGILATLVATPCTAPFMGAALGFALTQPAYVSMIVFLTLGFGLAIPYLALCFIPALRSKLPKPGAWMQTFKQFLSFPMFLTAVWLVWVLGKQAGVSGIALALVGIILISFIIWLIKVRPAQGFGNILSIILISLSSLILIGTFASAKTVALINDGSASTQGQNWSAFSPEVLDTALSGDAPVFTNMTADWCITCKVNEKIALNTETIRDVFANNEIQYLKGDWTNQDSDITQYLNKYDRQGVPLYVYYGPRDTATGERPDPVVLPQILTPGAVKKVINGQ